MPRSTKHKNTGDLEARGAEQHKKKSVSCSYSIFPPLRRHRREPKVTRGKDKTQRLEKGEKEYVEKREGQQMTKDDKDFIFPPSKRRRRHQPRENDTMQRLEKGEKEYAAKREGQEMTKDDKNIIFPPPRSRRRQQKVTKGKDNTSRRHRRHKVKKRREKIQWFEVEDDDIEAEGQERTEDDEIFILSPSKRHRNLQNVTKQWEEIQWLEMEKEDTEAEETACRKVYKTKKQMISSSDSCSKKNRKRLKANRKQGSISPFFENQVEEEGDKMTKEGREQCFDSSFQGEGKRCKHLFISSLSEEEEEAEYNAKRTRKRKHDTRPTVEVNTPLLEDNEEEGGKLNWLMDEEEWLGDRWNEAKREKKEKKEKRNKKKRGRQESARGKRHRRQADFVFKK